MIKKTRIHRVPALQHRKEYMGSRSHISGGDRSRTNWTPAMERFFIDAMLDQAHKGNRMGHTFNKQAWNDMLITFNENFGTPYDVNVLKLRYSNLWKQFNDVKTLLNQNGFYWDQTRKIIVAENSAWDAYIKVNPDAQSYRYKALTNFDDLCLIYTHTVADGRYSLSSHDVDFDDDILLMNMAVGENCLAAAATKEEPKTDWTLAMDHFFMNLMQNQLKKGNKINNIFSRQAWNDMCSLFNSKFSTQYSKKTLKLRHKKLFLYYTNLRSLLEVKGFSWDGKDKKIVADDVTWDDYVKAHPDANRYRKKSLPNYNELELIYGTAMGNGIQQESPRRKYFEDDTVPFNADEEEIQSDVNGDCASIDWTPSMDRCLIDILLEQVERMNKFNYSTDDQAWIDMVAMFKDRFGVRPGNGTLISNYKRLEKQYLDMENILRRRGFWWNEMQQMVTACDDVWDVCIEEHPGAKSYRRNSKPNYNDLCLIYGHSIANGQSNQSRQHISFNGCGPKFTNGYRWRTDWTPQMDRYFINLMLMQVRNGSMLNQKFNKLAWADIIAKFSAEFGSQYEKDVLKSRFLNLKKRFNDMKIILAHDGFAWDEMQQRVTANEDLWDAYVEEYPDARSYRNRNLPNFNDLYLIFGNARCTGKERYSNCSIATEDDGQEVNVGKDDQSPANIYPPGEHPDLTSYGDGLLDAYEESFTSLSGEIPNGGSIFFVNSEAEGNNILQLGSDNIFCDLQYPTTEFKISDQRKKRQSASLSKAACGKKLQRTTKVETQERYEESGLLAWLTDGEEEEEEETNSRCSIESIVGALEAVPDMTDELFLEACEVLEDERKAKMFVAMDVTERKKWLSRKLCR